MADTIEYAIWQTPAWLTQAAGEYARFGGESGPGNNLSLNTFNRYFGFSDAGGSVIRSGAAVTYVSPTTVKLDGGSIITLNFANVATTECCLRFRFSQDGGGSTKLSNMKFFAYNGAATTAPNCTVVAFAIGATTIEKSTDTAVGGNGNAWNSANGVGGSASALLLSNSDDGAGGGIVTHNKYLGVSVMATQSGEVTFNLAMEYDVV